jgi:glycosyltransferase involved in cell wall biosynthesis
VRVTYVNKYYYPHLGGVEYILRDIASGVAAKPGWQADALVANEGPDTVRETVDGVDVTRLGRSFAYSSTPVAFGMRGAIKARSAGPEPSDLINLHFPYPWGEWEWLFSGSKLPMVVTYHSDIVRQKRMLAMYRPVLTRVLDRADLIIASSPNMVEHSEFLAPRADKCRVVPFGLDPAEYADTPEVCARAAMLRKAHTRPIVLFVGRLIYYKGVDVLMDAMSDVDADLVVIGKGPLKEQLEQSAADGGFAERVTFLDPVDDDELVAWYHAADVFVLPSVARSEAFGLVQIEAHASGTPVVSTTLTTGVPFVNADGVSGLTVPPGDAPALARALQKLVTDDELRERLGRQARQRALKEFTIERMIDQTIDVYEEAMAMHGGSR